jgi:putative transposase
VEEPSVGKDTVSRASGGPSVCKRTANVTFSCRTLDLQIGTVIDQCQRRHRHQGYVRFLREIDTNVPARFAVHLIVDNYATHKRPACSAGWLHNPEISVHHTPTYASWLNQEEIWLNIITQKAVRRGTFRSVKELVAQY